MTYNMSFMDNGTNILDVVVGVNTHLADGWIGVIMLMMIGLITFLAFKKGDTGAAIAVSSFITSVSGVLLFAAGLIGFEIMIVPVLITVGAVFMQAISND